MASIFSNHPTAPTILKHPHRPNLQSPPPRAVAAQVVAILAAGSQLPFSVEPAKLDLPELQGEPEDISKEKCRIAAKQVGLGAGAGGAGGRQWGCARLCFSRGVWARGGEDGGARQAGASKRVGDDSGRLSFNSAAASIVMDSTCMKHSVEQYMHVSCATVVLQLHRLQLLMLPMLPHVQLGGAVMVEDTSLCFNALKGLPGGWEAPEGSRCCSIRPR
jgi:hypothetical protein